eukprot:7910654-Ditylum_brightwellii.AAC.1
MSNEGKVNIEGKPATGNTMKTKGGDKPKVDMYIATLKDISAYVGCMFERLARYSWQPYPCLEITEYAKIKSHMCKNMKQAYMLVHGQCSIMLISMVKGTTSYHQFYWQKDMVALHTAIQ